LTAPGPSISQGRTTVAIQQNEETHHDHPPPFHHHPGRRPYRLCHGPAAVAQRRLRGYWSPIATRCACTLWAALGVATCTTGDDAELQRAIEGRFAVLNALPFHCAVGVATLCARAGVHYFDLTEDVPSTQAIRALAQGARSVLMPQCGLAPGFIGIVGNDLARRFDELHSLRMRVGALPRYPQGALRYNLTWSTEGLINEYCNLCEAIVDGAKTTVAALDGLETFALDGVEYEAFNTSGGLGTLTETLAGRARQVDYKSIRYPGHCAILKLLLNDLRLRERRDLLKEIFEAAIPTTEQDVIVVFASSTGVQGGPPGAGIAFLAHSGLRGRWAPPQRDPAHHGCGHLRRTGSGGPGEAAAAGLCGAGTGGADRFSGQPLWQRVRHAARNLRRGLRGV
jgi:hypothetical protein